MNLDKLYVPNLNKLAQECNIVFKKSERKAEKVKIITNAGIPEDKLIKLFEKYFNEQTKSKSKSKSTSTTIPKSKSTAKRLNLIEDQIKYLMAKIDNIEVKLANVSFMESSSISTPEILDIKNIIKSKISPGKSIDVDELLNTKGLNKYTKDLIYMAVMELVDEEVFDVSEGKSKNKIQGYIGRLIRR